MNRQELRKPLAQYRKEKCAKCGRRDEFDAGGYHVRRKILTVHHIDGNLENNDPRNLQTLCRDCHKKHHEGGVTTNIKNL